MVSKLEGCERLFGDSTVRKINGTGGDKTINAGKNQRSVSLNGSQAEETFDKLDISEPDRAKIVKNWQSTPLLVNDIVIRIAYIHNLDIPTAIL